MKSGLKHFRAPLTILAGFALAFIFLISLTIYVPLAGEILIGGVPVSRDFPTVSSASMQTREMQAVAEALTSFWFWCAVFAVGMLFTVQIWRWVRG